MKRPDADLIRRLVKSGALANRGLKFGGRSGPFAQRRSLEKVLDYHIFTCLIKIWRNLTSQLAMIFPADDGTLLGNPVKVIEKSTMVLMW